MNGLKGAEELSSFSGKTAGCKGNYFRQRMQNYPMEEVKGFLVGSETKQSV